MNATQSQAPVETVEQYIKAHPEADPKALLDVLLQQNVRLREEYRATAEVDIDDQGNFRPKNLAGLWRIGEMYARSGMTPEHYRGKPADCAIAAQMALRCRVNIMTFMQSSYIVHGKPGIEAKLAIAMLNASGQIKGRIRFKLEGEGKSRKCTAFATDADSGEEIRQTVDWATVEAEGWLQKSGSKWKTMPDLMFQYRSAMFLIRVFFPDVLMGMYSLDELDDSDQDDAPLPSRGSVTSINDLADKLLGDSEQESSPTTTEQAEPSEESQSVETDPELLEIAAAAFNVCEALGEVGKCEAEFTGKAKSDAEAFRIAELAEQARERIRSTRGGRSNGGKQQKELAGA